MAAALSQAPITDGRTIKSIFRKQRYSKFPLHTGSVISGTVRDARWPPSASSSTLHILSDQSSSHSRADRAVAHCGSFCGGPQRAVERGRRAVVKLLLWDEFSAMRTFFRPAPSPLLASNPHCHCLFSVRVLGRSSSFLNGLSMNVMSCFCASQEYTTPYNIADGHMWCMLRNIARSDMLSLR